MSNKGFTLVEILVVITIMAVAFGVGASSIIQVQRQGRDSKRQVDLAAIQNALGQYYQQEHTYPESNFLTGTTLEANGKVYMGTLPRDPSTTPPYCYRPQIAQAADPAITCDNTNFGQKCLYYSLFAEMEGTSTCDTTTGPCACGGHTYDYRVNP